MWAEGRAVKFYNWTVAYYPKTPPAFKWLRKLNKLCCVDLTL